MLNELMIKNYKETNAIKCMFIFPQDINNIVYNCPHLIFDEQKIFSIDINDLPIFFYKDIQSITISLCSRIMNFGKLNSKNFSFFKNSYWHSEEPILYAGKMGVSLTYCIDMQIIYNNILYEFESFSILNGKKILSILRKNNIIINDPINLERILNKYNTKEMLHKFLQYHYNDLSKKYNLDNPRGQILLIR